ncbi:MAG: DUF2027 domain-containing protein [Bacteroidales bacterium]|nr:DUF2027 domain-containing protein [Bacteroidales bacterium]
MRFKIGDKVNFLNENGGGTITAIVDQRLVKIETGDGFEMPVLSSDLILDFRAQPPEEKYEVSGFAATTKASEPETETAEEFITEINPWGSIQEEKGIYLAFEPHEQQWLLTGEIDVHLINHTENDILYSLFMQRDGQIKGIDFSSVPKNSKIVIDTIGRDHIEHWTKGYLQVLLHSDLPEKIYLPVHTVIDIKANRFFKEGSFQPNTLIQGKALIISIATLSELQAATDTELERKYGQKMKAAIAEPVKEKPLIDKHRTDMDTAVIDLHIGEVVDNIAGLSSRDMFNIQLDYFRKTLESAIKNDYRKITYIHGVGNGVLKNAIINEMENYDALENRMASISKFGVGAVDVLIKPND